LLLLKTQCNLWTQTHPYPRSSPQTRYHWFSSPAIPIIQKTVHRSSTHRHCSCPATWIAVLTLRFQFRSVKKPSSSMSPSLACWMQWTCSVNCSSHSTPAQDQCLSTSMRVSTPHSQESSSKSGTTSWKSSPCTQQTPLQIQELEKS
jgi:hypothetical protein